MLKEFNKRPERTLTKRVRLTPRDFHYRLALEKAGYNPDNIDFDAYYDGLKQTLDSRDRVWISNNVVLGAIFLYHLGALEDFDFFGISPNPSVIGYLLIIVFSLSSLIFSSHQAKLVRYQSIFNAAHDLGTGSIKQDMILRYPRAYNSMIYANWMSGGPRFMYPEKSYPIRIIFLLLIIIPALIAWVIFMLWLLFNVSHDLWTQSPLILGWWSKVIVVVSWCTFASSMLLPTLAFKRIEFEHYGLTILLKNYLDRDPERYKRYLSLIKSTNHGFLALKPETRDSDFLN